MRLKSGNYLLNQSAFTLTSTVNEQLMAQSVCAHTFENDVILNIEAQMSYWILKRRCISSTDIGLGAYGL
jgi:hypothetical protein